MSSPLQMVSVPLVREGVTDLTPFAPPIISQAHGQWLQILSTRLSNLETLRHRSRDDFNYGGSYADAMDFAPLEEEVEEARRMVWRLGGEIRRRSEGELPVWTGRGAKVDDEVDRRVSTST